MKQFNDDRPRFAPYGFSCELWKPQMMARADQHDEVELNYLTEGSLTYLMGGRRVTIPARRLAAFWATVPHQIVDYEGSAPYYVATIPFAWFLQWGVPSRLHMRVVQWEIVLDPLPPESIRERFMFEQWIRDVENQDLAPAVALEIQARLLRLAHHLTDEHSTAESHCSSQAITHGKAEQMACLISRSYQRKLTVPEIAADVELHPDYAATLFRKTFGMTIVTFITRHRIAHAQRLLLSTDEQIIKIASESGFDSLSRFNRAFKQMTGLTPREYRSSHR